MNSRSNIFALVVLSSILAGCDHTKAPPAGKADPLARYPQQVTTNHLNRAIVFGKPIVEPSGESTPLTVTQPVRNTGDFTIHVQYRFQFLDGAGRPLRDEPAWRFVSLSPRLEYFMQANAMETEACDWRLTVQPAH